MARVNLDGKVWKDPRVRRLAKRCGWSIRETVGTLAAVWDVAYDAKNPIMSAIDIDTAAEFDGFASALQADDVQLGDPADGGVRLHGVLERIQYLLSQAERGRLGGLARAANAERSAAEGQANAKQTPSERLASSKRPPSLPLAPDPSPALGREAGFALSPPQPKARRVRTQLPDNWEPNLDHKRIALEVGVSMSHEVEVFRLHWKSEGEAKADWDATFSKWLRRANQFRQRSTPQHKEQIRRIPEL